MISKNKSDPLIYQGKNKNKKYFEGWYFKQVSSDLKNIVSIIPGISKGSVDAHSFIQVIVSYEVDGAVTLKTHYFKFLVDEFMFTDEPFSLNIGNNKFSNEGVELDLKSDECFIMGSIQFSDFAKINRSVLSPTAMGCFSYITFMECYHDIVSMNHNLKGELIYNNKTIDLNQGKGYIEKDWGTSFPKEYVWFQSNNFSHKDASVMFSFAHIPFLGTSFKGFISNVTFEGNEYRFATYNNSKVKKITYIDNLLEIIVVKREYQLLINAEVCESSGELKSPINGTMDNMIKEGLTGRVSIKLTRDTEILFEDKGNPCAIEIMYDL